MKLLEVNNVEVTQQKTIIQRVVSNFGWSIVSEAIGKGIFFFVNIYLARTLGVSNYGLFTLAQTLTYYFWLVVDLGTNMYGIREIAKNKKNAEEIVNPLLTLRITAGIVVFTLYTLSILFFFDMPFINKLTFTGCGLYLITYSFYTDWVLKGLEKFKFIALGSLISSVTFLSGTFYFIKADKDVSLASFIWSLSYFFGSLSLFYFLYKKIGIRYRPSFNFNIWLTHIRESIFFTISGSLMVIYHYLPILFLSAFFTNREIGLFAAPFRVVLTIGTAGFLLPSAFYPVLSEAYHKDRNEFGITHKKLQEIMLILGLSIGIGGAIFAKKILMWLFGDQYLGSISVFKIIIWLIPLYFTRYSYGSVILAAGFQRWHSLGTITGVVVIVVSCFILIPRFNVVGASLSLLIAEIAIVLSMWMISRLKIYG